MMNQTINDLEHDGGLASARLINVGERAFRPGQRGQWLTRVAGAALATLWLTAAPAAPATPEDDQSPQWSEWTPLGGGYVGRRREPPRLEQPLAERRHASTESRLRGRAARREAEALSAQSGKGQAVTLTAPGTACTSTPIDALWLRTGAAGFYAVPIKDLAAGLGHNENQLRNRAAKGLLSLTSAGQPWSWSFNPAADTIEFAAEPYETFFTDENAYRFSLSAGSAQPMGMSAPAPTTKTGASTPFWDTLKFEDEPKLMFATWGVLTKAVPADPDADFWFWDYLFPPGNKPKIDLTLAVPAPAPAVAEMAITLQGSSQTDHQVDAYIVSNNNETKIGSVTWNGFNPAVLKADLPQDLLNSSGNTTLRLLSVYKAAATYPIEFLDKIEISYLRQPIAVDGVLWLHDVPAGVQTVTGFNGSDIVVIESPTGRAVMRRDARIDSGGNGWAVTFETTGDKDYLIVQRDAVKTASLAPDYRSKLSNRNNRANYLIVTADEFAGTAEALAQHRRERYPFVEIACLSDIYDEFSGGREDPTAITRFMDLVVKQWRKAPSAVTLVGAGKVDHKDRMGYSDSFLPVVMTSTPWALAPSDERLLAGDGDAPFAFGRLPITNNDEGVAYVDKLIQAETSSLAGRSAVLAADNADRGGDFRKNSDELAELLTNTLGFSTVTKLYHPGNSDTTVRTALTHPATWETADYVSYDGHGSVTQAGDKKESFITATDAAALSNAAYPIFTALTCAVGDDSLPGTRSLAGALVLNPFGGAIASLAPTGLSYDADAHLLGTAFVKRLFGSNDSIGEAARRAKMETKGDIAEFMSRIYGIVGDPSVEAQ